MELTWRKDLDQAPWVSKEFDMTLDTLALETAIHQLTFKESKRKLPVQIAHSCCCHPTEADCSRDCLLSSSSSSSPCRTATDARCCQQSPPYINRSYRNNTSFSELARVRSDYQLVRHHSLEQQSDCHMSDIREPTGHDQSRFQCKHPATARRDTARPPRSLHVLSASSSRPLHAITRTHSAKLNFKQRATNNLYCPLAHY